MYGFSESIPLNKEEILKRVSQEEIWKLAIGEVPKVNQYITSPLRKDNNPGCWFAWYNGLLRLNDFGSKIVYGGNNIKNIDCFLAMSLQHGLNFYEVLQYLNSYFNIGLANSASIILAPKEVNVYDATKEASLKVELEFRAKGFDKNLKEYFNSYEITQENIIEDNIFATYWFRLKKGTNTNVFMPNADECCYTIGGFEDSSKLKICRAKTKNKKHKWITNCVPDDIGYSQKIDYEGKQLLVQKSWKDARVVKNQGVKNNLWFQNETAFPSPSKILSLCRNYEEVVIFMDNDEQGRFASKQLGELLTSNGIKSRELFTPGNIKDPAQLVQQRSGTELKDFLRQNAITI